MQRVNLNGVDLEYTVQGSGEPLVLIHGAILADAFFPLLAQPRIANTYRVIAYHRRGFAGSSRASAPFLIGQQAADARALLRHLGITRAHIAGHSYGAAIALQWALDAPDEVQSLALLEPPFSEAIPSGPTFWEGVASVSTDLYERGDKLGATDAFLTGVVGAEYRQVIATSLPPGAFELAVADVDTFFQVEVPALQQWRFTAEDAARIRQPVLAVVGTETAPVFRPCRTQAVDTAGRRAGGAAGDPRTPDDEPRCSCRRTGRFPRRSQAVRGLDVKERAAVRELLAGPRAAGKGGQSGEGTLALAPPFDSASRLT